MQSSLESDFSLAKPFDPTGIVENRAEISQVPISPEVVSWEGRSVRLTLGTMGVAACGVGGFLAVEGALLLSSIAVADLGKAAFVVGGVSGVVGIAAGILCCCTNRFIAEKKLESNVSELGEIVKKEDEEIQMLKREKEDLSKLVEELKKQMLVSEKIVSDLKAELDQNVKDLNAVEIKLKSDAATLTKVNQTIDAQKIVIKQIEVENTKLKKICEKIKAENDKLKKEVDEVRIQINSYDSENEEFKAERSSLNKEKEELKRSIAELGSELDELKKNYAEAQRERAEVLQKAGTLDDLSSKLQAATSKLHATELKEKTIIDSINQKIEAMEDSELLGQLVSDLKPLLDVLKETK